MNIEILNECHYFEAISKLKCVCGGLGADHKHENSDSTKCKHCDSCGGFRQDTPLNRLYGGTPKTKGLT